MFEVGRLSQLEPHKGERADSDNSYCSSVGRSKSVGSYKSSTAI